MKILVADDSRILREAVTRLLRPEDFDVVTAADGVEAITKIFEERPDLVLLDLTMPRLNGYVVCRLIKEDPLLAAIPVLILTARDSVEDRYWADRSGADGFLTKDALGDGLVNAIKAALASQALTQLSSDADITMPALGETDVLTRVCELLDRKLFEATVVAELASVAGQEVQMDRLVAASIDHLSRLVRFDAAGVAVADLGRLFTFSHAPMPPEDLEEIKAYSIRHVGPVKGSQKPPALDVVWLDKGGVADDEKPMGWGSWYAAGLRARGSAIGLLVLAARGGGAFTPPVVRTLRTIERPLAGVIASGLEIQTALAREAQTSLQALYAR